MEVVLVVGLGGAVGAILRWWVGVLMSHLLAPVFLGTLVVNLAGSFLVGVLLIWFQGKLPINDVLRTGIVVGLLGGFTTFSTFGFETLSLIDDGEWARASTNVVLSNGLGLLAVWLGYRLAGALQGA